MKTEARYPIYIVTKGRWESRLTHKALTRMGVPHYLVVEEEERHEYEAVISHLGTVLVRPESFVEEYETMDPEGDAAGLPKGSGPSRNFAWWHSIEHHGAARHWVVDDNIRAFVRANRNTRFEVLTPAFFRAMEDWADRYENVALAGPHYEMFAPRKFLHPPFVTNTRAYSCILIDNALEYRWRCRYNEDTDLSLRVLKDGMCTVQFYAFLQRKMRTLTMKGGNTDTIYKDTVAGAVLPKTELIIRLHPDVAKVTHRYSRVHHYVDYKPFRRNVLRRRKDVVIPEGKHEYGMAYEEQQSGRWVRPGAVDHG